MVKSSVSARMIAMPSPPSSSSPVCHLEQLGIEPLAVVRDLDRKAVDSQLVADLDGAVPPTVVGVADRVRARLRQCELHVRDHLRLDRERPEEAR